MGEPWSNWAGSVHCETARIERPRDEQELLACVRRARDEARRLRVVGSGHSFAPVVATDGVLVSLDAWQGVESVDAERGLATLRAGTKICDLGAPLLASGLALANQGDIDVQALAGALMTGTHGTGPGLPNLSAGIERMRVVTAAGELEEWGPEDAERLAAARVSLGALCVVSAFTLRCLPAYRLHERVWRASVEQCLDELDERIRATRHFEFFWYPRHDVCELKALALTDAEPDPMDGVEGEYVDWSWRVFPSVREQRFNEMEIAVPAALGERCFREVRTRMREKWPDVVWPVEFRTLAADEAWLSQAHGQPMVTISIHEDARRPCDELFRDLEPVFAAHGGRPHWGKRQYRSGAQLAPLYPRWDDFCALRSRLDPQGTFLNPYLEGLFA